MSDIPESQILEFKQCDHPYYMQPKTNYKGVFLCDDCHPAKSFEDTI